jgi:UDP-2,4-diacetamido-2,4,6-trideoxy-beta-L-altropyranose hydrolase
MKPKIFIRVDGSPQIGLGHLVRCTALALILKDDFEIIFFFKAIPESSSFDLQNSGFRCVQIKNEEDFLEHLTIDTIAVLDGYHFDTDFQKYVKAKGAKLVCIDDLHDKEFVADLVINHTPGISPHDYKASPHTQFALGLDYALLRPAFLEQAKKQRTSERNENVLICFGGSDPENQTLKILKELTQIKWIINIHVVIGNLYQEKKSLEKYINSFNDLNVFIHHSISADKFVEVMKQCQVGITSASVISLECLAIQLKLFVALLSDNQKYLYQGLINENYAFKMDDFFNTDFTNLNTAKQIIDGYSRDRLIVKFNSL